MATLHMPGEALRDLGPEARCPAKRLLTASVAEPYSVKCRSTLNVGQEKAV